MLTGFIQVLTLQVTLRRQEEQFGLAESVFFDRVHA